MKLIRRQRGFLLNPFRFGASAPAWAFIEAKMNYSSAGATSRATAALASVSVGHVLAVFVRYDGPSTTTSVTDSLGNTYNAVTEFTSTTGPACGRWFWCVSAFAGSSVTATVTFGASRTFSWIGVMQFSVTGGTRSVDGTPASGTSAAATSVSTSSFTTSGAGLLLCGMAAWNQSTTNTMNNGLTQPLVNDATNSNNTLHYGDVGYLITSGPLGSTTITNSGASASRGIQAFLLL